MAFPIIPKRRSGATGNPTSLELGELATNTATGELFLGGDGGVMLLNPPTSAGTTVTERTGDGTTVAFTFTGYNGTSDGGYLVSVGGIDQPPSKYSISNTNGGTITFVEAPVAGELISIRAIVAGSGGGSGDATSLQRVPISATAPSAGQTLQYNATTGEWEPSYKIPEWQPNTSYGYGEIVSRNGVCFRSNLTNNSFDPFMPQGEYVAAWSMLSGPSIGPSGPINAATPAGWILTSIAGSPATAFIPYYI